MAKVLTAILLDDNPQGLRLIQEAGWSGKAFVVPRNRLRAFQGREESGQPGVYFLFGEGDDRPTVYIGQSRNVSERLARHDSDRSEDEWDTVLVFVGDLDDTFVAHIERVAIEKARKANRYAILNAVTPRENRLSEAQVIIASSYFDRMQTIIGLFGYKVFEDTFVPEQAREVYSFTTEDAAGYGYILDTQEFVVLEGSTARIRETDSFGVSGRAKRAALEEEGVLKRRDTKSYEFTRDCIFTSPSAAADAVAGRSCNGWTAWKNGKGKTLDEIIRG